MVVPFLRAGWGFGGCGAWVAGDPLLLIRREAAMVTKRRKREKSRLGGWGGYYGVIAEHRALKAQQLAGDYGFFRGPSRGAEWSRDKKRWDLHVSEDVHT